MAENETAIAPKEYEIMYPRKRRLLEDEYGPQTQMQAHQQGFYENLPNWSSRIDPSVLERVSRQPPGKRGTWLARGTIKEKGRQLKERRRANMMAPMMQRQEMMRMNAPLGDREKLALQQQFQQGTQERGFGEDRRAALLSLLGRRQLAGESQAATAEAATTAHGRTVGRDVASRAGRMDDWRTQQTETPQTLPQMRGEYARGLEPGTSEWERTVGIPQEDPYRDIPSLDEQANMYLSQFQPGSPEWMQAVQEIEAIKRAPPDVQARELDLLNKRLTAYHKTFPVDQMGRMMGEGKPIEALSGLSNELGQQLQPSQEQYQIGQILTNPQGQQGKVVGFNPDGTPLIEPL